jgi:hypothetical protein
MYTGRKRGCSMKRKQIGYGIPNLQECEKTKELERSEKSTEVKASF